MAEFSKTVYSMTEFKKDFETCMNMFDYILYKVKDSPLEDRIDMSLRTRQENLQHLFNVYHDCVKIDEYKSDCNLIRCRIKRLSEEDDKDFRREYNRLYTYRLRKEITLEHWKDIYERLKKKYRRKGRDREARRKRIERQDKLDFDKWTKMKKITMII